MTGKVFGLLLRLKMKILFCNTTESSEWKCTIVEGTSLRPLKGKEPNWFHRFMMKLILGFKWEKDEENSFN